MTFVRIFCELLVKAGDQDEVVSFFKEYCPSISGYKGNEILIPSLTNIVRTFDWSRIGDVVLELMGLDGEKEGLSPLKMTLRVIDGLDEGAASEALIKLAVQKASLMDDKELLEMKDIGLLWKWAIRSGDKNCFETLAKMLVNADTSQTGPSIRYLCQYLNESEREEKSAVLTELLPKRSKFLEDRIDELDTKFSWEMPNAEFPDNEKIQVFLRSPKTSMTTKGLIKFRKYHNAQAYAVKYIREEQKHCSFEMEAAAVGNNEFVTITKTRDWFLSRLKDLVEYQSELRLLKDRFEPGGSDKKRARLSK